MYKNKETITYIAKVIEKDKSVVSREIKRNSGKRGYSAKQAQESADERQLWRFHPRKFTNSMVRIIKSKLIDEQWSPEQIRGNCLKMEFRCVLLNEFISLYGLIKSKVVYCINI